MYRFAPLAPAIALAATLGLADPAAAATLNFTVDYAGSSVSITDTADGFICSLTSCGIEAGLAFESDFNFTLGEGQSSTFDFITFSGQGTGAGLYQIEAKLAFSAPEIINAIGSGGGGYAVFGGYITAGKLKWNETPIAFALADGSNVEVEFEGGFAFLPGFETTSSATVTLTELAPVPLPAAGLMLLGALGGLGVLRRRKHAA